MSDLKEGICLGRRADIKYMFWLDKAQCCWSSADIKASEDKCDDVCLSGSPEFCIYILFLKSCADFSG